jgi:hypothetical protein
MHIVRDDIFINLRTDAVASDSVTNAKM